MKTFLELEGELGSKPQSLNNQFRPSNQTPTPHIRKETKATGKRKRLAPTKKFKIKVVARPNTNKATAQPLQASTKAPINTESQRTLTPNSREPPPPLEDAPALASTPWPEARRMSSNLFEIRKDWPIPPANDTVTVTIPKPLIKIEPQVPSATVSRPE